MSRRSFTNAFSVLTISLVAVAVLSYSARGQTKEPGGQITAELDGRKVSFPVLKSDIIADVQGDIATVTVVQTFANPTQSALNATYLFPLNKDAAVYAMQMEVGDEIVQAVIKKKAEAQATFDAAKRAGKAAALLKQHRPNMFTQNLANLMPGMPVKITMKYTQTVPRIDGAYELVVPLVVGPRYQPAAAPPAQLVTYARPGGDAGDGEYEQAARSTAPSGNTGRPGLWELQQLPQYPDVGGLTIPDKVGTDRVSIRVNLNAAVPLALITSATHTITQTGDESAKLIKLAEGRTVDNRDFVLRYKLAGMRTAAGFLTHKDQRGGFFSLLIEPLAVPAADDITPRELVFVLDTSGSMSGVPIEASKTFMRHALRALRGTDYFRIVRFSSSPSEFTTRPVPAAPGNVTAGLSFIENLSAGGGTEVGKAITRAFSVRQTPETIRIVVFLSDGYIGNEAQILDQIADVIGQSRIYAFGVGTSVNRYLLAEMARKGRGFARFIDPTETSNEAAIALAKRLEVPVLTDIKIDWGLLSPADVAPAIVPDLFKGDSIRVQGRFTRSGRHTIAIEGKVNGRKARLPLQVDLPAQGTGSRREAIPLIWARRQIAETMRAYTTPPRLRAAGQSNEALKQRVVDLGLKHSLATQWTSFVAVSRKVVNADPASALNAAVPLPMVKGVTRHAYPRKQTASFRPTQAPFFKLNFTGNSAPEPDILGGLAVLALAGLYARRRRRREAITNAA